MENTLYTQGILFGKKVNISIYQKNTLLKHIQYHKRNDFIEYLLKIAVQNKLQIPDILIETNGDEFFKNAQMFMMGLHNGSLEGK